MQESIQHQAVFSRRLQTCKPRASHEVKRVMSTYASTRARGKASQLHRRKQRSLPDMPNFDTVELARSTRPNAVAPSTPNSSAGAEHITRKLNHTAGLNLPTLAPQSSPPPHTRTHDRNRGALPSKYKSLTVLFRSSAPGVVLGPHPAAVEHAAVEEELRAE